MWQVYAGTWPANARWSTEKKVGRKGRGRFKEGRKVAGGAGLAGDRE